MPSVIGEVPWKGRSDSGINESVNTVRITRNWLNSYCQQQEQDYSKSENERQCLKTVPVLNKCDWLVIVRIWLLILRACANQLMLPTFQHSTRLVVYFLLIKSSASFGAVAIHLNVHYIYCVLMVTFTNAALFPLSSLWLSRVWDWRQSLIWVVLYIYMGVWRATFSSRPQHLLSLIVVCVIFQVDCSEEDFGFHSQTNHIIFSWTPVHCGCIKFFDPPPKDTPL